MPKIILRRSLDQGSMAVITYNDGQREIIDFQFDVEPQSTPEGFGWPIYMTKKGTREKIGYAPSFGDAPHKTRLAARAYAKDYTEKHPEFIVEDLLDNHPHRIHLTRQQRQAIHEELPDRTYN